MTIVIDNELVLGELVKLANILKPLFVYLSTPHILAAFAQKFGRSPSKSEEEIIREICRNDQLHGCMPCRREECWCECQ